METRGELLVRVARILDELENKSGLAVRVGRLDQAFSGAGAVAIEDAKNFARGRADPEWREPGGDALPAAHELPTLDQHEDDAADRCGRATHAAGQRRRGDRIVVPTLVLLSAKLSLAVAEVRSS